MYKRQGKYIISATPFNKLMDNKGNLTGLTYGEETFSDEIVLNTPKDVYKRQP